MKEIEKEKKYCKKRLMETLEKGVRCEYPNARPEYWKGRLDQLYVCVKWLNRGNDE